MSPRTPLGALNDLIEAERRRAVQLENEGKREEADIVEARVGGMRTARQMLTGVSDATCAHHIHEQIDGVWYCKACGVAA